MSFPHRIQVPLAALLIVSTLAFEAAGYAVQDQLPERRRADGVSTPFLSGLFLYLSGERGVPALDVPAGDPGTPIEPPSASAPVPAASSAVPPGDASSAPEAADGPDEPLVFTAVDDSYFDDALFIGDSRIDDMHSFSGLNNATYYAKTGMSVYKLFQDAFIMLDGVAEPVTLEDALARRSFGKIYLMVGVNELGTGDEARFIKTYQEAIERIRALQPDAIFYVMGVLSVTKELADVDEYVTLDAIRTRNADLAALADGRDIFYIDVNTVFADEDYYLDPTYADGDSHLKGKYYRDWADYLRANAIVR